MAKFLLIDKSTCAVTNVLKPITAMVPNNSTIIPPITGTGMVDKTAPVFPIKDKVIAKKAAHVIMTGLKDLVNATAPVTSE